MNPYIEKLKDHIKLFPKDGDDFNDVLDLLCYYFTSEHSVDTAVIRAKYSEVGNILEKLSLEDNDTLFTATTYLCDAYSSRSFREGVRVGAELMLELQAPTGII